MLARVWMVVMALVVGFPCAAPAQTPATVAIAPVATGQKAAPELQRVFSEELPRALTAVGFQVKEPKEVDLQVAERPEFLRCASGGCLAEEAAFLRVARLVLPRLEVATDAEGGLMVTLVLYDAATRQPAAQSVGRCTNVCTADKLRQTMQTVATELHANATRTGTLEVVAHPHARVLVDGRVAGETPWRGELEAGDHVVVLEVSGARVQRDVTVAPDRLARVDVDLEAQMATRRPRFRVVKWIALGAGVAALAIGGGVWSIDGHPTCTLTGTARQCPHLYDTLPAGAALVGIGGALLVSSAVMFFFDAREHRRSLAAALAPLPGGAALAMEGRF
jgi:hypothetical protein